MRLGLLVRLRGLWRAMAGRASSSLVRRIVVLNLAGLVALFFGFLYLNQFREGLIEARVQSLLTQGEIIAGAIAASAVVDSDTILIDPDRLLQMQAGESSVLTDELFSPLEFSISPEQVAPLLRRLVTPTRTRARVYDREASLLLDTRALYSRGDILRLDLPPIETSPPGPLERAFGALRDFFAPTRAPSLETIGPTDGRTFPEVRQALRGERASVVRLNPAGETIVSVAVPIQRQRAVRGVLLLSTQGGDIDAIIASERFALLQVFMVAAGVMIVLSLILANAIAGPVSRLAEAAERVRRGIKSRQEIPDFTGRSDEIGHLSGALREMTEALYDRIEAIESFAADVAHELKNPLTSLRSAVETLPLARSDDSRRRLLDIIQHDVRRLDRLISDISDASRLDAELARSEAGPVDIARLLTAVVSIANDVRRPEDAPIDLQIRRPARKGDGGREGARDGGRDGGREPGDRDARTFVVIGHDSRLGQVVRNLLDNARSFSPPGATVRVVLERDGEVMRLVVEDEGPGIPEHALERVFERFYTDRPEQGFGQNSGLGLSISRQIVQAHRGSIRAENRLGAVGPDGEPRRLGARFVVTLPAVRERH
ncbi:stimulus-sensing domain-containing protein [Salinarimonas rosea]|uniref:stimulus-sensing domain-containing protein n=1 Tax=Salinarimonas rosea TaxID=552063 RepID=UPI0005B98802|nr:stimulus-sensing domain-containing protein [Salinarimonas rosea]